MKKLVDLRVWLESVLKSMQVLACPKTCVYSETTLMYHALSWSLPYSHLLLTSNGLKRQMFFTVWIFASKERARKPPDTISDNLIFSSKITKLFTTLVNANLVRRQIVGLLTVWQTFSCGKVLGNSTHVTFCGQWVPRWLRVASLD